MTAKHVASVIGAGSWGTALAHHLSRAGSTVSLWGRDEKVLHAISAEQTNTHYFPGLTLHPGIAASSNLEAVLAKSDLVVFALPSGAMRELAHRAKPFISENALVVSTVKGLEEGSLKFMTQVIVEELGISQRVAVLSGPSFAREVVLGLPTAVTVAARDIAIADDAAQAFHFDNFRVYTSSDVIGVEFGGVMKNVIALAVGVVDGLGMGFNARAALLTRGLAEMKRLTVALGGESATVSGLSGLGDLLLTATGDLSRNRQVGLRLGKGEKLPDIMSSLGQVAEAVTATHKVLQLAKKHSVEVPIVEEVDRILSGKSSTENAASRLLARSPVKEIS